jgi:hypothetical protein
LTVMSGLQKGPNASKTVSSLVAGWTQVINRYWLTELNYSAGTTNGYQTDPYRILSVVDPSSGGPVNYLYESRPKSRFRQSVYWGNKIAIGPTVLDVSARIYQDSWKIHSSTEQVSWRVPITSKTYVEPEVRYYRQTAANFFKDYLVNGQALPIYASSDIRLGSFNATTFGLKVGHKMGAESEAYLLLEDYRQKGLDHPAGAIGDLAQENLFSGVHAYSLMAGYSFAFR